METTNYTVVISQGSNREQKETTMETKEIRWTDLTLYSLDAIDHDGRYRVAGHDQRPLTHASQPDEYEAKLREYRSTGGIAGWVTELPSDGSPEAIERACEAGPSVDEIDWSGLD